MSTLAPRTGDDAARPSVEFIGPVVPRPAARRDKALAILLCASLVVHATVLLPSLMRSKEAVAPPTEIPIEVVQLPPEPPKPPKAAAKPPVPPAPKPVKAAQKEPERPKPQKAAFKPEPKPQPNKPQPKQPPSPSEKLKQLLGAMPAVALPGATADGSDDVSYSQLVLSKVAKAKKEGRYPGVPGAAGVAFTLGDGGEVVKVEIVRPSGDPSLDAEAIAMVKRGAPYPPPPPGGRRDYAITLRFQPII